MKENTLYVGGGLREHIILCLLPIIHGMCLKKKINKIIFEKELSNKVKSNFYFKKLENNFQIIFLNNLIKNKKNFLNFLQKLSIFFFIFCISFFFKKKHLLDKTINWVPKQFLHSFWDTGIINNKSHLDKIELKSRILTCFQITNKIIDIFFLKKFNLKSAIIGHSVYSERIIFMLLRKYNVETFLFQKGVLSKQIKFKDRGFKYLQNKILKKSYKLISNKKINKYWSNCLKGKTNYQEANIASQIKNKKKNKKKVNVIMLHIFKDSAFEDIDVNRIFANYYTWIVETLDIIKNSNEIWILRNHPSAIRWGENQKKIIDGILKKIFKNRLPKNIFYEENIRSNLEQYKISKRVVTFSGNSHLEAACFGIKPIVISDVTLSNLNKKAVYKPSNIDEYKKILLHGNDDDFKLSKKDIEISKRIIYLTHNVVNLTKIYGNIHVFRSDKKKMFKEVFNNAKKGIKNNYKFLFELGKKVGVKFDQGISKNYFYKFFDERN